MKIIILLQLISFSYGEAVILTNDGKYLGNFNHNPTDVNSIYNSMGPYGPNSANSVTNKISIYGSEYSIKSPNNILNNIRTPAIDENSEE